MEERIDVMTDRQLESVLMMIRGAVVKCADIEEAVKYIDDVIDGKQRRETKKQE